MVTIQKTIWEPRNGGLLLVEVYRRLHGNLHERFLYIYYILRENISILDQRHKLLNADFSFVALRNKKQQIIKPGATKLYLLSISSSPHSIPSSPHSIPSSPHSISSSPHGWKRVQTETRTWNDLWILTSSWLDLSKSVMVIYLI